MARHGQLVSKLHDILRPFLLRRLKTDIDFKIPKKGELVLFSGFTPGQKALYDAIKSRQIRTNVTLSNTLMQLRKACNHPYLFEKDVVESFFNNAEADQQQVEVADPEEIEPPSLKRRQQKTYKEMTDKDFDNFLENGADSDSEEAPKPKATPAEPKVPRRSGYAVFCRDFWMRYKSDRILGKETVPFGELMKDVAKQWSALSEAEKEPFLKRADEELESYLAMVGGPQDIELNPKEYLERLISSCGKMSLLHRMLPILKNRKHKVLIFSQMTRVLDLLEDYLSLQKHSYCRIDGSTAQKDRQQAMDEFNNNEKCFAFLLSTRAGGVGINLTSADTVIIYDSDWNPQADLQAQDRCHRIGQTKPVAVYRIITANSVEMRMLQRAREKLKLEHLVISKGRFKDREAKTTIDESMSPS